MREIVLDTETTGLNPRNGDKIVEIGCVELFNHLPTGKNFHCYLNPQRDMPEEAFRVHGLSAEFLSEKPLFISQAQQFLDFIQDSPLIIHNAPFDMGFLNAELKNISFEIIKNKVIDTVILARKVHPGARVSLDALCKNYNIDLSRRELHGALLDSEILAEVYLELIGGRQVGFALNESEKTKENIQNNISNITPTLKPAAKRPIPLTPRIKEQEIKAHEDLLEEMGESALWQKYE